MQRSPPPIDPDLTARYDRTPGFIERFEGTRVAIGVLIGQPVVLSVIGRGL